MVYGNLTDAGVPVIEALDITSDATKNEVLKEAVQLAKRGVFSGEPLSKLLAKEKIIPITFSQLVLVGEQTGNMSEMLTTISEYYEETNANIHRGVHTLSQRATDAYEAAREIMRQHLNAAYTHEVLFTAGTTHGINLVANGFASFLHAGDEVLISAMEHHSNIVPWQLLCEKTGARLRVIPMNENGELIQEAYLKLLNSNTKLVAVTHISNALGTINPIQEMVAQAHQVGAAFLVDGAQAVPHLQPDVQALGCDFYAFSVFFPGDEVLQACLYDLY
jgi:selenocysteine lyase/cysteine desulfurase